MKKKRAHVGGTKMLSACCWTWIFVVDSSLSLREGGKKQKFIVGMKKAVTNLNLNLISDQPSPNISSPHKMCC